MNFPEQQKKHSFFVRCKQELPFLLFYLVESIIEMSWQPNGEGLGQIVKLLKESQSGNAAVQKMVHQV